MLSTELMKFVEENLLRDGTTKIGPDDSLIDSGILTSMGLIRLVTFIEQRTGVRIPDSMITPDNFDTITAIERTVEEVRAQRA